MQSNCRYFVGLLLKNFILKCECNQKVALIFFMIFISGVYSMENKLGKVLLAISDIKKSLCDLQIEICKICREDNLKSKESSSITISIVSPEDYD